MYELQKHRIEEDTQFSDDKIETACQFPSHQMPHCLPSVVTNAAGAGTDEYGPDTVLP